MAEIRVTNLGKGGNRGANKGDSGVNKGDSGANKGDSGANRYTNTSGRDRAQADEEGGGLGDGDPFVEENSRTNAGGEGAIGTGDGDPLVARVGGAHFGRYTTTSGRDRAQADNPSSAPRASGVGTPADLYHSDAEGDGDRDPAPATGVYTRNTRSALYNSDSADGVWAGDSDPAMYNRNGGGGGGGGGERDPAAHVP